MMKKEKLVFYIVQVCCLVTLTLIPAAQGSSPRVAPGDEDEQCVERVPRPDYPPNSKPLMDSWGYINLLPTISDSRNPAWQQLDIDNNIRVGSTTSWISDSNSPCRQNTLVCGFRAEAQNNWLITQFINRTLVDGTRLSQVTVQIDTELICPPQDFLIRCHPFINVYMHEISTPDNSEATNTDNYLPISQQQGTVFLTNLNTVENHSMVINFETDHDGFYLGIEDTGTCVTIHRVLVYYHACPAEVSNLIALPETVSPVGNNELQEIATQCVENAETSSGGHSLMSTCMPGGIWNTSSDTDCMCISGFTPSSDGQACTANCNSGNYFSFTNGSCQLCPNNSDSSDGQTVCSCLDGFYRKPKGEEDLSCTQPPLAPRNLKSYVETNSKVNILWNKPLNDGERDDLFYRVTYGKLGRDNTSVDVNSTALLIGGLVPGFTYTVSVTAMNGITDQVPIESLLSSSTASLTFTFSDLPSTEMSPEDGGRGLVFFILVILPPALAFSLILLIVIAIIVCCACMHSKRRKTTKDDNSPYYDSVGLSAPDLPPPRQNGICVQTNNAYQLTNVLSTTEFTSNSDYEYIYPVLTKSDEAYVNGDQSPPNATTTPMIIAPTDDKGYIHLLQMADEKYSANGNVKIAQNSLYART